MAPRLLKLTPLDAHLAGKDKKFHGGQFSWVSLHVVYYLVNMLSLYSIFIFLTRICVTNFA